MNKTANFRLAFFLFIVVLSQATWAEHAVIRTMGPPFPPYTHFAGEPDCPGVTQVVNELLFKGENVEFSTVHLPYARMLYSLKTGEFDMGYFFKNSALSDYVEYIGPLSSSRIIVISHSDVAITSYDQLSRFNNNGIAVIRGAEYLQRFDNDTSLNKVEIENYQAGLRMLKHGRVDAMVGSMVGIEYAMDQIQFDKGILNSAFEINRKEVWIHLSKKSPGIRFKERLQKRVHKIYEPDLLLNIYLEIAKTCNK